MVALGHVIGTDLVCHGRASGDDERTRALSKVEAHRRIIEGASIDFSGYFAAIARHSLRSINSLM